MKIVIYCGPSLEKWSPKSIETGIGGSEEAVINIAKQLSNLGHTVVVYNECQDDCGVFSNVRYASYDTVYSNLKTDILIVWRNPDYLITHLKNIKARKKYLWLHDITPINVVLPFIHLFDKIMVLSNFHRQTLKQIPDKHFFITTNGVDLSLFDELSIQRDKYLSVYGSSYDRGLKEILENWSTIKTSVPQAKLNIFYGWNTAKMLAEKRKDKSFFYFKDYMEELMEQEGIQHLGRINHREVAKQFKMASLWLYPSWWPETNNITAIKAQVGGAIPVTVPSGATQDTVKIGYKAPMGTKYNFGNELSSEIIRTWVEMVINIYRDFETQETVRKLMISNARNLFCWSIVAKNWERDFYG